MSEKIMDAMRAMAELSIIGLQSIEAQHARQGWIEAKRLHRKTLLEYVDGMEGGYQPGDDEGVDAAYQARRATARSSRSEASKLRRLILRYEATQEEK